MKILEYEVADLDTFDADVLESIENAKDKVLETVEEAEKLKKQSEAVRMQCGAVAEFIDTLWGKGTAVKVFGEKCNLLTAVKAFENIVRGFDADTEKQSKELKSIMDKYSPKRTIRENK